MTGAAPRITAGYDADAPREMVFPAADRSPPGEAPAATNPGAMARELAVALTALCGAEASVVPMAGEPLAGLAGWSAADGSGCVLGGGLGIAAALLNRECGGAFVSTGTASAHAARRAPVLLAAVRDLLVPGVADWEACASGTVTAFAVTVAGVADRIDLGLTPAAVVAPIRDFGDWPERLRARLDALAVPVRLVLHEGRLAVRAARALGVGDIIPIATAHEVGLRVGTLALARGQVIENEGGPPQVRIVARPRRLAGEQP